MPWGVVTAAVIGAASSADSSRRAANAQRDALDRTLPLEERQLEAQIKQADEMLAFNKETYADGKARQEKVDALNEKVITQNLNLSQKAGERADEQYNFYMQNGRPVVQKTLSDAENFDSASNIAAARGRATADVQQGFDNAQEQTQRALTRMGVNPSSGRFLALQQRIQADKAAALAGAATNAEQGVRDQAIGLRQQASNLAQGFPAQSMGQAGQSGGFGVSAAGVAGSGQAQNMALASQAMNGMQAGAGIYGNAAAGYGSIYGQQMAGYNAAQANASANLAGWGQLAGQGVGMLAKGGGFSFKSNGGYDLPTNQYGGNLNSSYDTAAPVDGFGGGGWKDGGQLGRDDSKRVAGPDGGGGKVKGPGTGTSDSVQAVNSSTGQPVRLSNGEYVLSADTVRAVGTKFLDNLQAKHHKPVNLRSTA